MIRALGMILALSLSEAVPMQAHAMDETIRIPSGAGTLQLFMRHQSPVKPANAPPVLIIHGATFPSGSAAAWKIDGVSWMDELAAAGFDVWALDFLGYGLSDRYPEMAFDEAQGAPLGSVEAMADQIARAVSHIVNTRHVSSVHLVAHSAGTFAAARYTELHTDRVARLVLFGAPAPSGMPAGLPSEPLRHFQMSRQNQLNSFEAKVRQADRLDAAMFDRWAEAYLKSDARSGERNPPSVRVPSGMRIANEDLARSGRLPYDPARIVTPTLVILGEWDQVTTPQQGLWLFEQLAAPLKRLVILSRGGHRVHLEASRFQLYREIEQFLCGGDERSASIMANYGHAAPICRTR